MVTDEAGGHGRLLLHRSTRDEFGPTARGVVGFEHLPPPEQLAPLMLAAYRGTPDDEGETLQDTVEVIRSAMAGVFGTWLAQASFVAVDEGDRPIGAAEKCYELGVIETGRGRRQYESPSLAREAER